MRKQRSQPNKSRVRFLVIRRLDTNNEPFLPSQSNSLEVVAFLRTTGHEMWKALQTLVSKQSNSQQVSA